MYLLFDRGHLWKVQPPDRSDHSGKPALSDRSPLLSPMPGCLDADSGDARITPVTPVTLVRDMIKAV